MEFDFNSNYPVLEGERLVLKRITKDHAESVFQIKSDPKSMNYVPRPLSKTLQDIYDWIDNGDKLIESKDMVNFGMFLKEDPNTCIGIIGYVRLNKSCYRGEIGYVLHSIHHRKGYASEALKLLIDFGFNVMKFHTIEAHIEPSNTPSIGLVEKAGLRLEAEFKENFFNPIDKCFKDTNVYSQMEFDSSFESCCKFGFFKGDRVVTTVGWATVLGVRDNHLWYQADCETRFRKLEGFGLTTFKLNDCDENDYNNDFVDSIDYGDNYYNSGNNNSNILDCNQSNISIIKEQYRNFIIRKVLCQKQLFRYIIRSYDTYAYRKGKFSEQSKRGSIVFNLGSWWRFTYNEVFSVDWMLRNHHFGLLADKLKREPHKLFYPDLFTMNLLDSIDIIPFDVFKHLFRIYGDSIKCDHFYNPLVQNAFLFGRKDIVEHIQRSIPTKLFRKSESVAEVSFVNALNNNHLELVQFCVDNFDGILHKQVKLEPVKKTLAMARYLSTLKMELLMSYIGSVRPLRYLIKFGDVSLFQTIIESSFAQILLQKMYFSSLVVAIEKIFYKDLNSDDSFTPTAKHLQLLELILSQHFGIKWENKHLNKIEGVPDSLQYLIDIYHLKIDVIDSHPGVTRIKKVTDRNNCLFRKSFFKFLTISNNRLLNRQLTEYIINNSFESIYNHGSSELIRLANNIRSLDINGGTKKPSSISVTSHHTKEIIEIIKEFHHPRRISWVLADTDDYDGLGIGYLLKTFNIIPSMKTNRYDLSKSLFRRDLFEFGNLVTPERHLKLSSNIEIFKSSLPSLQSLQYIQSINSDFTNIAFQSVDQWTKLETLQFYLVHCSKTIGNTYYRFLIRAMLDAVACGRLDLVRCLDHVQPALLSLNTQPLEIAIQYNRYDVAEFIITQKIDSQTHLQPSLFTMLPFNLDLLRLFVGCHYDRLARFDYNDSRLEDMANTAIRHGRIAEFSYMLEVIPGINLDKYFRINLFIYSSDPIIINIVMSVVLIIKISGIHYDVFQLQ
ncbi:hypothetical protein PPL_09962 [Heterostelium album PN500]|uniref:N-acetyltransferase domain-containing protein n=1 Tax=Heterostelium pallidum (strain ATCC 26659 / Pp 5 / PN500) TaxID=670386 RepID=D3BPN7_HETP5|nr:hypothetical protein PPL_09962 [Heterostelium album PN500]EFA76657.1 hypothetical protein PPL_09962 [Heterostelium album PN500]|eukprot:XP_020428789.1 hypothetical protein PPL_09962 [Heterostelium album PN500]